MSAATSASSAAVSASAASQSEASGAASAAAALASEQAASASAIAAEGFADATAADATTTAAHRDQTAADRVATGQDAQAASTSATAAAASASAAATAQAGAATAEAAALSSAADAEASVEGLVGGIGTLSAILGQVNEEVERLSTAQEGDVYTLLTTLETLSILGQLADQVNGGQIALKGGTLADPALHIGTVGVYSSAANTLSIAIAGSEVARITASGLTVYGTVTEA